MAVLTMFYGIIISMYYYDNRQHHFPHVHVKCQGEEAVIRIPDGEMIEGELPQGKINWYRHGLKSIKMSLWPIGIWLPTEPMFSKLNL